MSVSDAARAMLAILATCACLTGARAPVAAAPARSPRIVSLIPALTEDLFAIGAGPDVIAVSQFTDYPPAATHLPEVASFASVDTERIVRLHPDLVIGIPAQARLVADLERAGLRVELIDAESYDQIFSALARLGALTGRRSEARALVVRLRARTAQLTRDLPSDRPSAFVVLETNPIVTVGNRSFIGRLIALAGGVNAPGDLAAPYPRFSGEALLALQPDAIIGDRYSGLGHALGTSPWNALRAVRAGHVYVLDDADILERPGPRYNDGLAWLIARLHGHAQGR